MVKIAYLECPTGISGDMCLGALVDAGVPWEYLSQHLKALGLEQEYQLSVRKVHRNGQIATKVDVNLTADEAHHPKARHLPEIETLIQQANLPIRAERWSLEVFRNLAIAEGAVHGIEPERVHFHEVGATDAIVDIVGSCLGLDWLGVDRVDCSPMPTGGGTVRAAHGLLPVPTPAVLKLWETRQVPIYSNGIDKELVTPTGAAIATTLAHRFGPPPALKLERVGLGAGSRDLPIPNILRLWLGESSPTVETQHEHHSHHHSSQRQPEIETVALADAQLNDVNATEEPQEIETIAVLETQLDDLSPQAIAYTMEALLEAGALDVFTQAIGMKKSRSGFLLTAICHPELSQTCQKIVFQETTTLGIRHRLQKRQILPREIHPVETPYGTVRVKIARKNCAPDSSILNVHPEYEDCARLARATQQPWQEIHRLARQAWGMNNEG
ncbi:nickel pincer cofactor biosynthesis protein LarC [Oscillatoria sp. FACHB-1406]|uniref:nickel pincer cofactor biosynthesis protein LarC n=1 Tax=Oscillatoria sp. FACHB-1406 TaxID=2692846 RepID=UPI00168839F4|nr:nickel pincer cofactor biosynthesis protein LarC [Oscillatoria sp. FACHB-1406]MBD2578076.1 nickel pincer cofactor biosynthesis protein LarC [Oscillatoria sp. FACHB-1406]